MAWQAGDVMSSARTGAWQSYTPSRTDWTLGSSASQSHAWARHGDTIIVKISYTVGTGISFSTDPRISLPVAASGYVSREILGSATFYDTSGGLAYLGVVQYAAGDLARFRWPNPSNSNRLDVPAASVPFTWDAGDLITMQLKYRAT